MNNRNILLSPIRRVPSPSPAEPPRHRHCHGTRSKRPHDPHEDPSPSRRRLDAGPVFLVQRHPPPWTVPTFSLAQHLTLRTLHAQTMVTQLRTAPLRLPFQEANPLAVPPALTAVQKWVEDSVTASHERRTHSFGMVPLICAIVGREHAAIPFVRKYIVGEIRWDCFVAWFKGIYQESGITADMLPWCEKTPALYPYLYETHQNNFFDFELAIMEQTQLLDGNDSPLSAPQLLLGIWNTYINYVYHG